MSCPVQNPQATTRISGQVEISELELRQRLYNYLDFRSTRSKAKMDIKVYHRRGFIDITSTETEFIGVKIGSKSVDESSVINKIH